MNPVRFTIPVLTTNPLNGSIGMTPGAARGRARQNADQRVFGYFHTMEAMRAAGVATKKLKVKATKRVRAHVREVVALAGPWLVTVTRIGPRKLDKLDGLGASIKHVVDGIALALNVDDGDEEAVEWVPKQRRGAYAPLEVEISPREVADG